jgi:hypothetical protein
MNKRTAAATVPERPTWIKPSSVNKYVELGTTKIYDIIARGLVISAAIGGSSKKAGTRLINLPDLERYIAEHASGGATTEVKK